MKIIRNGIEYELTVSEMRNAYIEMEIEYIKEDIIAKADELEVSLKDKNINTIIENVHNALNHNDSWFEAYWMTIEYALRDLVEEKV